MKMVSVKLDDQHIELLNQMSKETGKNKSDILRDALDLLTQTKTKSNSELMILQNENKKLEMTVQALNAIASTSQRHIEDLKINAEKQSELYERNLHEKQRIIDRVEVESSDYRGNMEKALQEANNYRSLLLQYASYGFIKRMLFKIDSSKL